MVFIFTDISAQSSSMMHRSVVDIEAKPTRRNGSASLRPASGPHWYKDSRENNNKYTCSQGSIQPNSGIMMEAYYPEPVPHSDIGLDTRTFCSVLMYTGTTPVFTVNLNVTFQNSLLVTD